MRKVDINCQDSVLKITTLMIGTGGFNDTEQLHHYFSLLDRYIALGGNCIDTARHYGVSENIIGLWLKERGCRDEMILLTKGGHPDKDNPDQGRLSANDLERDLECSLTALQTDQVDLYALHRDDIRVDVGTIMNTLQQFVTEGKVRAIGVSNWTIERIQAANHYAHKQGLTQFSFNSPGFSLAFAKQAMWPGCVHADPEMLDWHQHSQLPVLAWSPQAGGFFSGKYSPSSQLPEDLARVYADNNNWRRLSRAGELSTSFNQSPSQMALSYVLNQSFPSVAIIGARTKEHIEQAVEAAKANLTQEQISWLTES